MKYAGSTEFSWFRVPVVWLAAAVLLVSLAGSAINIMIAMRHAHDALEEVAPTSRFQLPEPQG